MELFCRGMISLTLTIVNIVCILIVGVIMLLIKQVQDKLDQAVQHIYLANIAGHTREHTSAQCFFLEE